MYPLNDNDLDRLSREAADQYDVEQNTSGWEALEIRLNRELPLKEDKERRRFLFWLFLIVLLAGGGVLWTMTGKKEDTTLAVSGTNTIPTTRPDYPNTDPGKTTGLSDKEITQSTPTTTGPATAADTQHEKATTSTNPDNNTNIPGAGTKGGTTPKATESGADPVSNDQPAITSTEKEKNNIIGKNASLQKRSTAAKTPVTKKARLTTTDVELQKLQNAVGSPTDKAIVRDPKASIVTGEGIRAGSFGPIKAPPFTLNQVITTDAPTPPKKKKGDQKNSGFEIGIVAGPDMSNVKFTDMDKVGYNAGLQIGYRFSDRWSVNTGLLYTKKNYTAQGKDFTKPNNNWWQNKELHTAQGYCAMFDIPLNIRYDLSVNKKQRWFASAGVSSYIMTNEDYTYNYYYIGGSTLRQSYWESDSTSTYLFSILNLSAGFERALNKRFSLQVEPYFKIPMKGLGYGKLDLNSYGIYFSVKYKFNK